MLGPLCAFLSSLTWSVGSIRYTAISKNHSIYALNFTRALVALPLFVLATFLVAGSGSAGLLEFQALRSEHLAWLVVSMIASYGLGDLCFFLSTRSLGVPTALAIASAYPVWSLLFSIAVLKEPMTLVQAGGVLVVVAGVVWVILQAPRGVGAGSEGGGVERVGQSQKVRQQSRKMGVFLAVLTSGFWAMNSFAVSRGGHGLSPNVGNAIRMIIALLLTSGLRLGLDRRGEWVLPFELVRAQAWVFVFEAFGGSLFFLYGLSHSPLFLGTTLSALAPVLSVPLAVLLGQERFHLGRFAAILLVLLGIFAILLPR